jgi:hypothetical protein
MQTGRVVEWNECLHVEECQVTINGAIETGTVRLNVVGFDFALHVHDGFGSKVIAKGIEITITSVVVATLVPIHFIECRRWSSCSRS